VKNISSAKYHPEITLNAVPVILHLPTLIAVGLCECRKFADVTCHRLSCLHVELGQDVTVTGMCRIDSNHTVVPEVVGYCADLSHQGGTNHRVYHYSCCRLV
jgi:hypothetical protein